MSSGIYIKNPEVKKRKVGDGGYLYLYRDGDWKFYQLNRTGYTVWENCSGTGVLEISSKSGVTVKTLHRFIRLLRKKGLIIKHCGKPEVASNGLRDTEDASEKPELMEFKSRTLLPFIPVKAGITNSTAVTHPFGPLYVYLETTLNCNLGCKHCYISSTRKKTGEISSEKIMEVIDRLTEGRDAVKILFIGGEPFVRKDIFELLQHAKNRGAVVDISTNGWLLDREKISKLKEIGVDKINITLYDADGRFDTIFSHRGHYDKMLDVLRNSNEANLTADICFVMARVNYWELFKVYRKAKILGAKRFDINVYMPTSRMSERKKKIFLFSSFQTALFWGFIEPFILRSLRKPPVEASRCYPGSFPCIKPDGSVVPCNGADYDLKVGNILEDEIVVLLERLKPFANWEVKPCSYCIFSKLCIRGCRIGYRIGLISCPVGRLIRLLNRI